MFFRIHLSPLCMDIPFFPLLPTSQQQVFQRKFRVALRLVHRCPFVSASSLLTMTNEHSLDFYVKQYIKKRLKYMYTTDLDRSLFLDDIFYWDDFRKRNNDHLGHFFRRKRISQMIQKHESLLLKWISFTETEKRT